MDNLYDPLKPKKNAVTAAHVRPPTETVVDTIGQDKYTEATVGSMGSPKIRVLVSAEHRVCLPVKSAG